MKISHFHLRFILILLFMLTGRIGIAQNQYYKVYGTPQDDMGISLDRCADGGFIITGWTNTSSFREDGFILRTNSSGEMLWNKIIQFDTASVQFVMGGMLNDESIILIFREYNPIYQIVTTLMKLDSNGDSLWTRTFLGTDICCVTKPLIPLSNGEFLIAGGHQFFMGEEYSGLVMKLDSSGNTLFHSTFKCEGLEVFLSDYRLTPDSEIVLVGGLMEHIQTHEPHSFLVKFNLNGDFISGETYTDTTYDFGIAKILANDDHTYTLLGAIQTLIKTDTSGAILSSFKNMGNDDVSSISVAPGGYFLTGSRNVFTGYPSGLIRTNSLLDTLWTHSYLSREFYVGLSLNPIDNSITVITYTDTATNIFGNSDIALIQLDSTGNALCNEVGYYDIHFQPVVNTVISYDSSYSGGNSGPATNQPTWHQVTFLTGLLTDTICSPLAVDELKKETALLFPNPVHGNSFKLKYANTSEAEILLMGMDGKIISGLKKETQTSQEIILSVPASVANGIYFLKVFSKDETIVLKLVVAR